MAWYPGAVVKPITKHKTPLTASQVILHTAVSGAKSLFGFFSGDPLCSHFYVAEDGTVEQYIDTKFQAPANRFANVRAISIETWDGLRPDINAWNPKQQEALVALLRWLGAQHRIPLRLCTTPNSPGVGWHSMWGAPSLWTPSRAKTCPGPMRIPQIPDLLVRANITPTLKSSEDDMTPEQSAQLNATYDMCKVILRQLGGDYDQGKWPGWKQLGNRTLVDGVAAVMDKLGVPK
ncbi:peptidoglycan recognition family protein [Kineococcus sp. NPDC059986]|uniref:peptidoglycan recognition protein family protein n=1 Tax=Actinomycetes TaxID=1760 RepID=UPI0034503E61